MNLVKKDQKLPKSELPFFDKNLSWKWMGATTLKIIAIIAMFIDHFGLILFPQYQILREIGRLSLPIFAFLIAIGMNFTRDRKKYFLRLFIYFLILQVPISIYSSIENTGFGPGFVNIFFNLAAGAGFIYLYRYKKVLALIFFIVMSLFLILNDIPELASPIDVDYGWYGFYLIIGFFFSFEIKNNWKNSYSFLFSKIAAVIIFTILTITWISVANLWLEVVNSSSSILSTASKRGIYSFASNIQIYSLWCIPFFVFFIAKKEKINSFIKYGFYLAYPISFALPFLIAIITNF